MSETGGAMIFVEELRKRISDKRLADARAERTCDTEFVERCVKEVCDTALRFASEGKEYLRYTHTLPLSAATKDMLLQRLKALGLVVYHHRDAAKDVLIVDWRAPG